MDSDRSGVAPARSGPSDGSFVRRILTLGVRSVIAAVLLAALAIIATGEPPASGAAALSLGVLVLAADIDRRTTRLPDPLLLLAVLPVVMLVLVAALTGRWSLVVSALVGAVIAGAPVAALHAVSPVSMGFGDVKATLVLGASLGLLEPRLAPAALALAALSGFVVARATGRRRLALGPHLVLAALAVALVWTILGPEGSPWR